MLQYNNNDFKLYPNKTIFNWKKNILTSFNQGDLIPYSVEELLPSERLALNTKTIIRVNSPFIKAPFERFTVNMAHFKIPLRLLWENLKKFFGEVDDYDNYDIELEIPKILFEKDGITINNYTKSILSYMGVPVPSSKDINAGRKLTGITKLLSNGYALVWNNYFRDQNLQNAKAIDITDNDLIFEPQITEQQKCTNSTYVDQATCEANGGQWVLVDAENPAIDFHNSAPNQYTGKVAKVLKKNDYFTASFQDTQKGSQTLLNLDINGNAIVKTNSTDLLTGLQEPLRFLNTTGSIFQSSESFRIVDGVVSVNATTGAVANDTFIYPSNLSADLSTFAEIGINELREARLQQKMKEIEMVQGSRYFEIIETYFGITNTMDELNYPVLVGHSADYLDISQVVQTSLGFSGATEQGNIAGYSVGINKFANIEVFAKEHCYVMSFIYIVQNHNYQSGIHKIHTRSKKSDFWNPLNIGLGFQPIMKKEIYGHLTEEEKNQVFSYAPQGERLRSATNLITGQMNSNSKDEDGNKNAIDLYHFGDTYEEPPIFTEDWKLENNRELDRTLAIGSEKSDNFICNIEMVGLKISPVDAEGKPIL